MSLRWIVVCAGMLGCTSKTSASTQSSPSASTAASTSDPNGATTETIDLAEQRALCLLATLPTPPNPESNHAWDIGILASDKLSDRYSWVMMQSSLSPEEALTFRLNVEVAVANHNLTSPFCDRQWPMLARRSVISIVLRLAGSPQSGDYLVIGGIPEIGNNPGKAKLEHLSLHEVSLLDAKKKALELGFSALGKKLRSVHASAEWAELTHGVH